MIVKTEYRIYREQTYDQEVNGDIIFYMIHKITTDQRGIENHHYCEIENKDEYYDLIEDIDEVVEVNGGF